MTEIQYRCQFYLNFSSHFSSQNTKSIKKTLIFVSRISREINFFREMDAVYVNPLHPDNSLVLKMWPRLHRMDSNGFNFIFIEI
jgi:hypothetical protein